MQTLLFLAALLTLALPLGGALAQDADRGQALYAVHCATCHGLDGRGEGPMAGVLMIKPANLTELAAANGGAFPLERVVKRIDGRDPLVSHGSPMPVYGQFFGFDANAALAGEVPTVQPVADLVTYLQTLQRAE
ncbi:c-type cytochrome [Salipiger mangrovisoli]|uniref:Cytochrome c n=1 Tax=Salipiger mangrovisoli TaxID=2865933 RepID=A0ABR9X796_9RHOB|nr:cytochrome c [Salipiger mangrovisoli]MBE9639361.1 cytochrome c [Salipiger mangrovisoli]